MSGEFGSDIGGYFHSKIGYAVDDCTAGRDELTRLWGDFLGAFEPVSRAISWSEAGDSSEVDTIMASMAQVPRIEAALAKIKGKLEIYDAVVRRAVCIKAAGRKASGHK